MTRLRRAAQKIADMLIVIAVYLHVIKPPDGA